MRFDAIVVPRGAEARAVSRGWPAPRPTMLVVPAGTSAGRALNDGRPITTALVFGLCGALDPALRVGDTVVYTQVRAGAQTLELDRELAAACARLSTGVTVDAVAVDAVVGEVTAKRALRAASGAAVVDMESAAIAKAFAVRGVRVAMVRVVSDCATSELPDLRDVYDASGALRPFALVRAFARAPRRSAAFIGNVVTALRALRAAATRLSA